MALSNFSVPFRGFMQLLRMPLNINVDVEKNTHKGIPYVSIVINSAMKNFSLQDLNCL